MRLVRCHYMQQPGVHTILLLLLHSFNSLFSRTTWVSRHQKGKPFRILLEQEMMGWQCRQLDCMQIICSSLQTHNHASISHFLQARCPSCSPTNSVKALKARQRHTIVTDKRCDHSHDDATQTCNLADAVLVLVHVAHVHVLVCGSS